MSEMITYGDVECSECGRTFNTEITVDSYDIEGYTKTDYWPDEDTCEFCRGETDCSEEGCSAQATVYDKDGNLDYCAPCWSKMCDGEEVEYEECIVRLDESKHVKPKETG